MGLIERGINKAVTRSRIEATQAPIGGWIDGLEAQLPAFRRDELLTLATFRTMLELSLKHRSSTWVSPGQKQSGWVDRAMRSVACLIRAENLGETGDTITCGALPPLGTPLSKDWVIQADRSGDACILDVPVFRTLDNALVNYDLMKSTRQAFASVLAQGPGRVTLEPGLPDVGSLVEMRTSPIDDSESPMAHDHLIPIPEEFSDGAWIPVPAQAVDALLQALEEQITATVRTDSDIVLAEASLAGGRPGPEPPMVRLMRTVQGPALVFDLPEEGDHSRQRTFRAAMNLLDHISRDTADAAPGLSEALKAFVNRLTAAWRDPDAGRQLKLAWGENVPGATVLLRRGLPLPIALAIRTTSAEPVLSSLLGAIPWVNAFERVWTTGLRQATREKNLTHLRRGPGLRFVDEQPQSILRFAHTGAIHTAMGWPRVAPTDTWFWETTVRQRDLEDGGAEIVLFATGLSRAGEVLCYGQELLRLFGAFGWLIQCADPGAEIETLTLWA